MEKPYKIREKTEKDANYRALIRAELADELYEYRERRRLESLQRHKNQTRYSPER